MISGLSEIAFSIFVYMYNFNGIFWTFRDRIYIFLVTDIVILVPIGFDIILLSQLQFVVGLGDKVSPTDIEEGMRVG
jgi:hypothetical protein